jgi:hypothetical protein
MLSSVTVRDASGNRLVAGWHQMAHSARRRRIIEGCSSGMAA